MLDIQGKIVSLDLAERFFCCDLDKCLGECCIEGDTGAPVTPEEVKKIEELLPVIWEDLLPASQQAIKENGLAYVDVEGELVTQIVDGRNCVFSCYGPGGVCLCAIEKAYREGKTDFYKPISCHLYPARVKEYANCTVVNYDRWKICKCAEVLGRSKGVRAYQFLKDPLIRRFGEEWYAELCEAAEVYLASKEEK